MNAREPACCLPSDLRQGVRAPELGHEAAIVPSPVTSTIVGAAIVVGLAVAASRCLIGFSGVGEQDQSRLVLDVLVLRQQGGGSPRTYALYTSPLWSTLLSMLPSSVSVEALIAASNAGGWICCGLSASFALVLLHQLGLSLAWSAAGAFLASAAPGPFYASLYGYPSQYALPFLIASGVGLLQALGSDRHPVWQIAWLAWAMACYCAVALFKIDFALGGSLLLALALMSGRSRHWVTAALAGFPLLAACALHVWITQILKQPSLFEFLAGWTERYPDSSAVLLGQAGTQTVLYSCGVGTAILSAVLLVVAICNARTRATSILLILCWAISVAPLWVFWLRRHGLYSHPMSARHALLGAHLSALFATLLAARVCKQRRAAACGWPIVVVLVNWPFGSPSIDFNYQPSGNLIETWQLNRRAIRVAENIAERIARSPDPIKVVLLRTESYEYHPNVLGGIDLVPFVELRMAAQASSFESRGKLWKDLRFIMPDRSVVELKSYVPPSAVRTGAFPADSAYYAPQGLDAEFQEMIPEADVRVFDPNKELDELNVSFGRPYGLSDNGNSAQLVPVR